MVVLIIVHEFKIFQFFEMDSINNLYYSRNMYDLYE